MTVYVVNSWLPAQSLAWGGLLPPAPYAYPQAGSTDVVTATLFNGSLVALAPIPFISLTATLYYNAVGSWSMIVPYDPDLWAMLMAGDSIVEVNWRGLFSFGGKCEQPGFSNSLPGAAAGGGGGAGGAVGPFMNLSGADYLALVANRIAYPAPASAWSAQTAAAADTVTAVHCETALKHYVNVNLGAGAIAARRLGILDIAADAGRGANVTYTVHFAQGFSLNLMDNLRAIINASAGPAGMAMSVKRNGHRLTFDVYVPRDLTGKAWFSQELGNLTAVSFYLTDPTVTDALVRGSSSFVSSTATAKTQWNAAEQYVDQSSETVAANLTAAAQNAILQGAAGPNISASPADSPFLTFGRDYFLGDLISVEVVPGTSYSDVVSSVVITADMAQNPSLSVIPKIGNSADATSTDSSITGKLSARIRTLEKKLGV